MPLDSETYATWQRTARTETVGFDTSAGYIEADALLDVQTQSEPCGSWTRPYSVSWATRVEVIAFPIGGFIASRDDLVAMVGANAVKAAEERIREDMGTWEND